MVLISIPLALTFILNEQEFSEGREFERDKTFTPLVAVGVAQAFETQDRAYFLKYLDHLEETLTWTIYFFDKDAKQIFGASPTPQILDLAQSALRDSSTQVSFSEGMKYVAQDAVGSSGSRYVVVLRMPPPPRFGSFLRARAEIQTLRVFSVLMVGGLVCFWLARYISFPITRLRDAAHRLAGGNLRARVLGIDDNRHDEIAYLSRDFNEMAARFESLMDSQRRLTGDISHELRSPLARVCVALGLARREAGPEVTRYLDRIEKETDRLNELISNLLKIARIEDGLEGASMEDIHLDSLVREVAEDADFEARARDRRVVMQETQPCRLRGSWELLRSATENIVRNAVSYTKDGTQVQVWLEISSKNSNGKFASIRVRDQGPGLPEEELANIFQPFYRVGDARDRSSGGTGLGLAIAERAIALHGGQVSAKNITNGGLEVEIILPLSDLGTGPDGQFNPPASNATMSAG